MKLLGLILSWAMTLGFLIFLLISLCAGDAGATVRSGIGVMVAGGVFSAFLKEFRR